MLSLTVDNLKSYKIWIIKHIVLMQQNNYCSNNQLVTFFSTCYNPKERYPSGLPHVGKPEGYLKTRAS